MTNIVKERSAGAVIYRKEKNNYLYLLIKPSENLPYGFPKGKLEPGEDDITAAKREVLEETGLVPAKFVEDFSHEVHYIYGVKNGDTVKKSVIYFLAEVSGDKVNLSDEHICYIWVTFAKAKQILTYNNLKKILEKVEKRLAK